MYLITSEFSGDRVCTYIGDVIEYVFDMPVGVLFERVYIALFYGFWKLRNSSRKNRLPPMSAFRP